MTCQLDLNFSFFNNRNTCKHSARNLTIHTAYIKVPPVFLKIRTAIKCVTRNTFIWKIWGYSTRDNFGFKLGVFWILIHVMLFNEQEFYFKNALVHESLLNDIMSLKMNIICLALTEILGSESNLFSKVAINLCAVWPMCKTQ